MRGGVYGQLRTLVGVAVNVRCYGLSYHKILRWSCNVKVITMKHSTVSRHRDRAGGEAQTQFSKGVALHQSGNLMQAKALYEQALSLNPRHPGALHLLGVLAAQLGNLRQAEELLRKAVALSPRSYAFHYDLGNVFSAQKQFQAALKSFDRAVALKPDDPDIHNNRGCALLELKHLKDAITSFSRAIALSPSFANAYRNRGDAFREMQQYHEAIDNYYQAIAINPKNAEVYSNLCGLLAESGQFQDAKEYCEKAVDLQPALSEAWNNLGAALNGLGRYEAAAQSYEKCLELDPAFKFALGSLIHNRMRVCDWRDIDRNISLLSEKIEQGKKVSAPFPLLGLTTNLALQRRASELFAAEKCLPGKKLGNISRRRRHEKIRVGYFSADFRNHAVSFLMAEVFELHDRSQFETFGFSFGVESSDEMRGRVSAAFDTFMDVRDKSDYEITELARDLEIDIAVDLGGYTERCRPSIFSMRAAPVQVSYIGYLGTMGIPDMDYLIADKTIIPQEHQRHYAEKIVYLPSYQANDSRRLIAGKVFTREECGLPSSGFVFCCFNNSYKITPATYDGWMRILGQVGGSVLFLYAENDRAAENLRNEATRRGIDSDRIVFGNRLPRAEYLARYRAADLFLDTFPYNAGTTASDALWAGLPVLTLMGESFASRVAGSLLNSIGLSELITNEQEKYEATAVDIAKNPARLQEIKNTLARNRLSTLLFNSPLFTKHIEEAYRDMYARCQAGLPPEYIYIDGEAPHASGP